MSYDINESLFVIHEKSTYTVTQKCCSTVSINSRTSETDAAIQRKNLGWRTTLEFSNEKIDDIMIIVLSLEDARLLIKGIS